MAERVWVAESFEPSGRWALLFGTISQTRAACIAEYEDGYTTFTYAQDRRNGWVRLRRARITLEQPKSKPRTRRVS